MLQFFSKVAQSPPGPGFAERAKSGERKLDEKVKFGMVVLNRHHLLPAFLSFGNWGEDEQQERIMGTGSSPSSWAGVGCHAMFPGPVRAQGAQRGLAGCWAVRPPRRYGRRWTCTSVLFLCLMWLILKVSAGVGALFE